LLIDLSRIREAERRREEGLGELQARIWRSIQEKLKAGDRGPQRPGHVGADRQARPHRERAQDPAARDADASAVRIADLFDVIVEKNLAVIVRQIEHFGVPPADIEDVTQEVLAGVFQSTRRFDGARGKLSTWLYRVGFYQSRTFLGRAYHRREVLEATQPADFSEALGSMLEENDPETQAIASDDRRLVCESITKIAVHRRAVFIAYEIEEKSMKEIARDLGIAKSTGWSRLQQARREFAVALRGLLAREAFASRRKRR